MSAVHLQDSIAHGTPVALREFVAEHAYMAALQADLVPTPSGTVAELRAFLGETMALAAVHAELAETYATLGDDRGLEYACGASLRHRRPLLNSRRVKAASKGGR